jgi:tetratricopeptide (TPR) repeat protein
MVCHRLDHFAEARRHFENALALSAARQQQDQGEILLVMTSYGDMLSELDDSFAAASIFLRAEELLRTMSGADPLLVATVKHRHGNFLLRAGRLLDARYRWQEALEARARVLPENHPKISDLLNNLGYAAFKMGDMAEAEKYLERAVVADEASLGGTHPDLAYSLANLADVAVALGDLSRAEHLARRALVIREQALGPHHLRASYSLATLARIAALRGQLEESRRLYQQALSIRQTTLPAGHPAIGEVQQALAALPATAQ